MKLLKVSMIYIVISAFSLYNFYTKQLIQHHISLWSRIRCWGRGRYIFRYNGFQFSVYSQVWT